MKEETSNKILRDFIYLDKNRMYSLYSQLYKGVAESMVKTLSEESSESKRTRHLEETIINASVKTESVVLYDHIYNSLECGLSPHLVVVNNNTKTGDIQSNSFVKVQGRAYIADYGHLIHFIEHYNDIGLAITGLTTNGTFEFESQHSRTDSKRRSQNSIEKYAKENNLYLDKKFLSNLNTVLTEMHGDSMEIVFHTENLPVGVGFRAYLEDRYMRLPRSSIRALYGYAPSMELTLVGEVTNIPSDSTLTGVDVNSLDGMLNVIGQVEQYFDSAITTGRIIKVAPIAVYVEHALS